jgi:hypothetical protein
MDSTYVKEMERLANEGKVVEKDGRVFSSLSMHPVFYEPRPAALKVRTLSALCGYIRSNVDQLDRNNLLIHVESPEVVGLISNLNGVDRKRDGFLIAEFDGQKFKFDEWMPPEAFIIAVNALFIPTPDRDALLHFISKLKIENETNIIDDGISQAATARVGVKGGLTETASAPSRLPLKPFRTFREIEQPESEFIFRMKTDGGDVRLALFEADGGAWKHVAMESIVDWIATDLAGKAMTVQIIA